MRPHPAPSNGLRKRAAKLGFYEGRVFDSPFTTYPTLSDLNRTRVRFMRVRQDVERCSKENRPAVRAAPNMIFGSWKFGGAMSAAGPARAF